MKYLAQPYYSGNTVKIYSAADASLVTTIALAHSGPNDVIFYHDESSAANPSYMFVSCDMGDSGAIDVYDFRQVNLTIANNTGLVPVTIALGNSAVGMAIQPGTGDLYVATFNDGDAAGGVYCYSKSSGYAQASQFQYSSFNDAYNDVASYCANLAFDCHGHLWMTTFNDATPAGQFLICYTQVDKQPNSSAKFFKLSNGAAPGFSSTALPGSAAAPGPSYPFSQPEGIAFDPLGNLWLANNNDDFGVNGNGNGTLLMISRSWIDQNLLTNSAITGNLTVDGYGGTQTIAPNAAGVTVYYLNNSKFGGLYFDGYTLYANEQESGNVWQFDTTPPLNIETFKASGIATTYPGNGGMAMINTTPAALLIRDVAADTGAEPDTFIPGDVTWESPDIAVTNMSMAFMLPPPNSPRTNDTLDLGSDGSIAGPSGFAYVRVSNVGTVATTGTEVLKLYWAKASAGLDWPAPWDGLMFDTTPSKPVLGGLIGAQQVGAISPGNDTIFEFAWTSVPDSSDYSVNDGHFCLVARIEGSSLTPFGMTYPEQTNGTAESAIIYNTESNNKIGWRNIAILPPPADGIAPHRFPLRLGVIGANYSPRARTVRFAVETLGRNGQPAAIEGKVILHAEGPVLKRLLETKLEAHLVHDLGHGRFQLRDSARGIENIRLHANEVFPFHVEFTPLEDVRDFAVRVLQYVNVRGTDKVVGGQTFVVGKVHGFPVAKHR